jgi:DNA-binding IclR family transcriptional regulator
MPKVVERIGESAYLYAREGTHRVCLEVVETHRASIKHFLKAGSRFPLNAGASGKAILAFLSDADRLQVLKTVPLKKLGPKTLIDRREIVQELERIRAQGYAYSEEELSAEAWSLAVPLSSESGECVASLAVAGPLFRLNRDRLPEYVRFLRGLAGRIHKTLQGEALSTDRSERGERHGRHSR